LSDVIPTKALLHGPVFQLSSRDLDRGIQLKILTLLVFLVVFMDTVVKPRYDTECFLQFTQQCFRGNDTETLDQLFLGNA
jgi:hypothetical protein